VSLDWERCALGMLLGNAVVLSVIIFSEYNIYWLYLWIVYNIYMVLFFYYLYINTLSLRCFVLKKIFEIVK